MVTKIPESENTQPYICKTCIFENTFDYRQVVRFAFSQQFVEPVQRFSDSLSFHSPD